MRKFAKIAGITLLSLVGVCVVALLLARFAFRDQMQTQLLALQRAQRVDLLRTAERHTPDTVQFRFSYPQDTLRAREIRNYFRLDTLLTAGASSWEQTLAVARFVAQHIPHANQTIYPEQSNAIALWEYHLTIEPAFNCRLHSILLHELLLSVGITNRFITCLPQDPKDRDCHVVNQVWLPELHKWAMIDSDMQAYITDKSGTPLSLEQMRAHYIADEQMVIHDLLDEKNTDYYATYWAKNLYWFSCWEQAEYDKETTNLGRTIMLCPPQFENFRHNKSPIQTSDAARFWAAPESLNQ